MKKTPQNAQKRPKTHFLLSKNPMSLLRAGFDACFLSPWYSLADFNRKNGVFDRKNGVFDGESGVFDGKNEVFDGKNGGFE
jgi:hypothetical protein